MAKTIKVKTGQTLAQIAKENGTTVKAILAEPGNATIAARVKAGTQAIFGNSKVVIPSQKAEAGNQQSSSEGGAQGARLLEARIQAAAEAQIAADQALANAETLRKFKEKEAREAETASQKRAAEEAIEQAEVEAAKAKRLADKAVADAKALEERLNPTQIARGESGTIGAKSIEAKIEAAAKARAEAIARAERADAGLTPSALAKVESGTIGAKSIETQIGPTGIAATGPTGPTGTATGPTGPTGTATGPTGTATGPTGTATGPTGTTTGPTGPTGTATGPTGTATGPTGAAARIASAVNTRAKVTDGTGTGGTGTGGTGTGGTGADDTDGAITYTATDGTVFTDQQAYVDYQTILSDTKAAAAATSAANAAQRQSAYDLLYAQFASYGLGSLVEPLRGLIQSGASPSEFSLKLRESEPYKKRFAANQQRVSKGLKAISEAEYLDLEDQYQSILRNAGLPESYWKRGDLGVQEGFTNFIANDVSAVELEDRVATAQQRLIYANPEVSIALKTFYPDITNGDLLAYALDPTKGLEQIKRRITAAEVGSSAVQMGLATNVTDAEYLARYGVDKAQAQQGYSTIAGGLQRGSQLASIYGEDPYTQTTAEREVFQVPGAQEARKQRQKITGLEKATFGGQSGVTQGALARDRAGNF